MSRPPRPTPGAPRPAGRRARSSAKKKASGKPVARRREDDGPPRLQKLLAQAGVASRRAAETLIAEGRVRVDGRAVTQPGTRVDPRLAKVEVDGRIVEAQEPTYVVMNKPDEVVSSAEAAKDPRGRATVVSLLGGLRTRVVPLGRLDYHTRGVLLLTNDGALHAALLHPRRAVPKTYHAKFQGKLDEDALAQLHAGVRLEDGTRTRPSLEVEIVKATTTNTWVQLTISQGLNRQIRRMGDAIGHSVLKLIRVAFAGITGDGLREGQWRHLRPEEVAGLYTLAGLTAPVRAHATPDATPRGIASVRAAKSAEHPSPRASQAEPPVTRAARTPAKPAAPARSAQRGRSRPVPAESEPAPRTRTRPNPKPNKHAPKAAPKARPEARPTRKAKPAPPAKRGAPGQKQRASASGRLASRKR